MTVQQTDSFPSTDDFAALLDEEDQSLATVEENEITDGRILEVGDEYVLVDIGFKSEGRIPVDEFIDEAGNITIEAGDVVDVLLEEREDDEGQCVLSKERADRMKVWEIISEKDEADKLVRGTITNRVKGGLQVDIGVKAFLPGSQVELRPTRNLDKYIGQEFAFRIIKFNKDRGNIVLSRRALLEEERAELKQKTLGKLEAGAVIDGIVKNLTDYGAFVDLGGIDGLLHITDMSWGRVSHPTELFSVGDEIQVKVLKFSPDSERVSLGYKQLTPDPWEGAEERYPDGIHVLGRVVSLIDYGAFVELEEGIEGLVHISEMSWTRRIKHPNRVVEEGEIIKCVVLNLDTDAKKVSLGIKQIEPNPWTLLEDKYPVGTRIIGEIRNITDFGIFVGIEEGIDGLVHISDISWTQKIRHPSELYDAGEEVEAVVLNIDVDNERFSLGIKQLESDPWETLPQRYPLGKIVSAKITKLTDFGAFAEVEDGIEGLIHISELANERIENPDEVVNVGEEHKVEVISVDPKERKIALSIKNFVRRSETGQVQEYQEESGATAQLGDLLKGKLGDLTGETKSEEPEAEEAEEVEAVEASDSDEAEEPEAVEASDSDEDEEEAEEAVEASDSDEDEAEEAEEDEEASDDSEEEPEEDEDDA